MLFLFGPQLCKAVLPHLFQNENINKYEVFEPTWHG
jgi:hypothetical protein